MIIAELLGPDDAVKISFHQLLDEVDLFEVVQARGAEDVEY